MECVCANEEQLGNKAECCLAEQCLPGLYQHQGWYGTWQNCVQLSISGAVLWCSGQVDAPSVRNPSNSWYYAQLRCLLVEQYLHGYGFG